MLAGAVAAAYSYVAAGTTPFTPGADVATAVPFLFIGALAVRAVVRRRRTAHGQAAPNAPPPGSSPDEVVRRPRLVTWVVAVGFLVALELAAYFAGFSRSRQAFPTASSLYDSAAHWRAAKSLLFFIWLALGWGLMRR